MSVKACRQELPNKGVKLTAMRAAAYAPEHYLGERGAERHDVEPDGTMSE